MASNRWDWNAKKLLEWHREKAGSIEAVHDVLKNELAAGVDALQEIWPRELVFDVKCRNSRVPAGLPSLWDGLGPIRRAVFSPPARVLDLKHAPGILFLEHKRCIGL